MSQSVEMQPQPNRATAIFLIDEDVEHLEAIRRTIQGLGYSVQTCNSYTEGIRQLVSQTFDIIVVGQGSCKFEGRCVLEGATEFNRRLPLLVVARHLDMGCYLEAMQLGAVDYLAGPVSGTEIARVLRTYAPRPKASVEAERSSSRSVSERVVG